MRWAAALSLDAKTMTDKMHEECDAWAVSNRAVRSEKQTPTVIECCSTKKPGALPPPVPSTLN